MKRFNNVESECSVITMIGKEQKSSRELPLPNVLEMLEERKKGGELGYEQQLAYEHAKKFASISAKNAEKMEEELLALDISRKLSVKIIDIMPLNMDQLKQTVIMERKPIPEEMLKSMMEVVERYRGK